LKRQPSIVLDAAKDVHELFGANDENIALLEELIGIKVFIRGKEIFLDTENEEKRALFCHMLSQIEDLVKLGQPLESDLIRAIYKSLSEVPNSSPGKLKKALLALPHGLRKIYPKNNSQLVYLEALEKQDVVFAVGPAGTGKTYLAVAKALAWVLSRQQKRLVVTRPVVEAGESLGFLPGDLAQKINPYLRPIYDSMLDMLSPETVRKLEENGQLEIAPLAYMRGRTFSNCVLLLDEAQNTTRQQMKMLLTRLGEGSKTIITGDITQIDLPRKTDSGLVHALSLLKGISEIAIVFFSDQDVVRHELVRKIINAYEKESKSNEK